MESLEWIEKRQGIRVFTFGTLSSFYGRLDEIFVRLSKVDA